MRYIVLYPISLDSGVLMPAAEGEPPVLIDEATLFATPSETHTNEQRAQILIAMGAIAMAPEAPPKPKKSTTEKE